MNQAFDWIICFNIINAEHANVFALLIFQLVEKQA